MNPIADMDPAIAVRVEGEQDVDDLGDLLAAAFEDDGRVSRLVSSLRASHSWDGQLAFVAEATGTNGGSGRSVIGYVALTHGWLDAPRRLVDVLVLSPLAVAPAW